MSPRTSIRTLLVDGKRIARGRAPEVAELMLKRRVLLAQLVECLWDDDAGIANRAADALERASAKDPRILAPWKDALLGRMTDAAENKLRWNLALIIARTALTIADTDRAATVLRSWLDDKSSIVKTASMHGLAGLTHWNPALLPEVLDTLRILARSGTPAMRARGRFLLKKLETGANREVIIWPRRPGSSRSAARTA